MKKKDFTFILGLTLLMGVTWVAGEVVMGLWLAFNVKAHIFWFAAIVTATLVISVWHSFKEDESDLEDPKRAKYQRKTAKKKKR
jgi:uncharacterized membrane protein